MQISWRKNPKTEDGWFKRTAISLLVGLSAFLLSMPISFLLVLNYLQHSDPRNTQNFLGAMTSAVLIGLALGAVAFTATMLLLLLFSLRGKPASL